MDTNLTTEASLSFLLHCYKFLNQHWQHADRESLPDQGFEIRLRESCILTSKDWRVSQPWELNLGCDAETSSGTLHEIDLVVEQDISFAIVEAKNRPFDLPAKNDVIVFFAKIVDYLTCNPSITQKEVCPVFISTFPFERSGLAACLGLGIHPIAPTVRPVPILADLVRKMETELRNDLDVGPAHLESFTVFRSDVNHLSDYLRDTWFTARFGYQSQEAIVCRAVRGLQTKALSEEFLEVNSKCSRLITAFKDAKARRVNEHIQL